MKIHALHKNNDVVFYKFSYLKIMAALFSKALLAATLKKLVHFIRLPHLKYLNVSTHEKKLLSSTLFFTLTIFFSVGFPDKVYNMAASTVF